MKTSNYYLIHIQYLGFRYHGWQKQPGVITIESMIEKTIKFIFGNEPFRLLGASRTDAKVSANHSAFMLYIKKPLEKEQLLKDFNSNLPNDIKVIDIEEKDPSFNIINSPRIKEYLYLFSFGQKAHPFSASLMCTFPDHLDIEKMKQAAMLFEGSHNFVQYCTKPGDKTNLQREILLSRIQENTFYSASFFPEKSWALRIRAKGFLRYQIRLIMGQLVLVGKLQTSLDQIKESLLGDNTEPLRKIAPGSGLILNKIIFEE